MNSSLEFQVEIGIGPQLVIMGTILGSIFVGALTLTISDKIPWGETSYIALSMQDTENMVSAEDAQQAQIDANATTQMNDDQVDQRISGQGDCQISNQYPESIQLWCSEISDYAQQYGLSPDLIAAVMLQESGGNPDAYSHSGAVGLMQVMPRDGIAASFMCVNGPCFTNRPTISELQEPSYNIEYGARMLANLQTKYGNIRDALRSYGPMDVGYTYADKVLAILENYK